MNIVTDRFQITVTTPIHQERLVSTREEVAASFVANVETLCVNSQEPLHARDQIRLRRLDDQMKVVAHETIRVHLPFRSDTDFSQRVEESLPILIISKDALALVSSIDHMVNRTTIFDAQRTWHVTEAIGGYPCVNSED